MSIACQNGTPGCTVMLVSLIVTVVWGTAAAALLDLRSAWRATLVLHAPATHLLLCNRAGIIARVSSKGYGQAWKQKALHAFIQSFHMGDIVDEQLLL